MTRLLILLVAILPCAALGQGLTCADHASLEQRLADAWGESRQSLGLDGSGAVLETFANLETGTWTIALTQPGGPTCIVAVGEHYERELRKAVKGTAA